MAVKKVRDLSEIECQEIVVSICCITFNQEKFIKSAIESFLNQEVNFGVEILINDDASIDKTKEILSKYQERYPYLIKCNFQKENQFSKGVRGMNAKFNYPRARGKFIAICEGDDYWIDDFKLLKQVTALENDNSLVFSNTNSDLYYQNYDFFVKRINDVTRKSNQFKKKEAYVTVEDILDHRYIVRTASVMLRTEDVQRYLNSTIYLDWQKKLMMGDTPLWAFLVSLPNRKVHYLDESTMVYRRNDNTVSNSLVLKKSIRFELSCKELLMFFVVDGNYQLSEDFIKRSIDSYNYYVKEYFLFDNKYKILFEDLLEEDCKEKLQILNKNKTLVRLKRIIKKTKYTFKIIKYRCVFFIKYRK